MADRRHVWRSESSAADSEEMGVLRERIGELAASIHAAEARLCALLVELDAGDGWVGAGIRSMAHWLTLTCGFTSYEAERRARLARRREELPCLFEAFDRGALSVGFTAAAEKVAATDNDDGAATTPGSVAADDPEGRDPLDEGLWFHTWWDDLERLRIDARLDTEHGAVLQTLLEQLRTDTTTPSETGTPGYTDGTADGGCGRGRGGRRKWRTRPEAFTELLALAGDALCTAGTRGRWTERFSVMVTIDTAVLTGTRAGSAVLADGTTIDPATVRQWLPDAEVHALVQQHRAPLYMGRSHRLANRAQRRTVLARDGGCAFTGCTARHHLHRPAAPMRCNQG